MFALDPKLQARLRPHLSRVLILEDNLAYARMIAEMLRVLGADNIVIEADDRAGMSMIQDLEPQLIIAEYKTDNIDGIAFTRTLRHSGLRSKATPVIMVKGGITPSHLLDARNCGVHEMLSKPFAWQDLFKRLQNVLFKPRDWIEVTSYTGPDRRRFNTADGGYSGPKKRRSEGALTKIALEEAVRLLEAALGAEDHNTMMATVMQQMSVIVPGSKTVKDPRYTAAVSVIVNELRNRTLIKETLAPQVAELSASLGMDSQASGNWATDMFDKAMNEAEDAQARADEIIAADDEAAA